MSRKVRRTDIPDRVVGALPSSQEGPPWEFFDFVDARQCNVIEQWRLGLANMDRQLDQLSQLPKSLWTRPRASALGDHIYVIRFKDESGMQHRLFGHFVPGTRRFVLTLTGFEKDDKYYPADYEERAAKIRDVVNADFKTHTKSRTTG